jgi:putative ABC transport system substrate-binding protein
MNRRDYMLLGVTAALPPLPAVAQSSKIPKVGLLLPYVQSEAQAQARVAAFQTSLQERGWVDGRNVALELPALRAPAAMSPEPASLRLS